jgi:hypothetical protein
MAKPRSNQFRKIRHGEIMAIIHQERPAEMVNDLNAMLEPGMLVRHPGQPDWGLGQVQSNIAGRITVNFENAGKVVINGERVGLVIEF